MQHIFIFSAIIASFQKTFHKMGSNFATCETLIIFVK